MLSNTWPELPHPVSRIGLGCARLTGGMGLKQSASVIEAALDAGVTHFDTAPSYGFGTSEAALGRILQGSRNTTIATKVGIRARGNGNLMSAARMLLRPLVAQLPGLRARIGRSLAPPKTDTHDHFDLNFVRSSIEQSMLTLGRDRLDVLLLHEPSSRPEEALIEYLASMQQQGGIGLYGIGTGLELKSSPAIGDVVQHRWSPVNPLRGKRDILHGALRWWLPTFGEVISELRRDNKQVFDRFAFDASDDRNLAGLLLTFALRDAPNSTFLISSNDPNRIRAITKAIDWRFVASAQEGDDQTYSAIKAGLVSKIGLSHLPTTPTLSL
ncbi:aldo/keto reductase [Caulobacter sp. 1776]|uniref:aldo/keto reductase n=1 Tax=Caulobacter sp. 1776 TaxID=3156420 RepID=UPI003399ECF2